MRDAAMRRWKVVQLVGILILLTGVVLRAGAGEVYGTGIGAVGVLIFAIGRIAGWLLSDRP